MKTKEKTAYIAAGAALMAAIIGIVPAIINRDNKTMEEKISNTEVNSTIKIEDSEIKGDSINTVGNNGTINQTNNQPINNYYYYYYDLNDSGNHTEDESEKATGEETEFYTDIKVRIADCDDKTWRSSVYAKVGDIIEFQMQYENVSNEKHCQVAVRDILPVSLKYVEGSTILYNGSHPAGLKIIQDSLIKNGINIGNYEAGANAIIRFRAEIDEETLSEGINILYNWGQAQAGADEQRILQDDASVIVNYTID